jgi:sialate O-acetylesterase
MVKTTLQTFLFALVLEVVMGAIAFGEVRLPAIFTDNMILQQQTEVAIWGWAKANADVQVVSSWDKKKYTAKSDASGKWKTKITTPKAGGPYEITFSDGTTKKLSNILIGEIWLCSGQSNMEMPMKGYRGQPIIGSNEAILKSRNKNIRLFTVQRASNLDPQDNCTGQWQEATPETVAEFSATGYYFGHLLNEMLDVPVGLINVSWGGSCIQTWMSKNTAEPFETTKIPVKGDSIKVPNRTPTLLFNAMINPVIGYGIKGCIWYQGETNYTEAGKYKKMFATMVNEWRSLWGIGEFPFYYVQIAPYKYALLTPNEKNQVLNSAHLREAQLKAMDTIPNSGMAVIMDIGEEKCIHPSNKKVTGERLAYWALAKTYDIKGFGYSSPVYKAMEIKDSAIVISFDNVPNGITSFGKESNCFEIAGADKVFYPAKAILKQKSIVVSAPEVKNPVAVRYAFKDFIIGDIFGTEGFPVSSFRTDDW